MHLKIMDPASDFYRENKNVFPSSYLETLKWKPFFEESLLARILISQFIWWNYLPQVDERWIPLFQTRSFWSLSHKKSLVFVWVSEFEIGVDIEYLVEKSSELFDIFPLMYYSILWEKNWKHFYVLWTSFEAIQKMERWENINVGEFSLFSFETVKMNISQISFQTRTLYECKGKSYQVFTGFHENTIYSICTSQNLNYEIIV